MKYSFPLNYQQLEKLCEHFPTPFHIYDESGIRKNAQNLRQAFSWMPGFKNYFAVKALPNPFIMKILYQEDMGMDCSSMAELVLTEKTEIKGEDIMFSSNNTPAEEYIYARKLGAIINLDDISHIEFLEKVAGLPELISFRYNPGSATAGNAIIGQPEEAKYGLTTDQIIEAYKICRRKGVKRFGLHSMIASNELNEDFHIQTARMLFDLVAKIRIKAGVNIDFIDLGGGYGIPYHPNDRAMNINKISAGIKEAYEQLIVDNDLISAKVVMENGRMVTGPFGWLVTRVRHLKETYRNYVGVDASMADLMRPGMYGAYHHISIAGKENDEKNHCYDVTGPLCENNDKFAIQRMLPKIAIGDLAVIHDTGAHGHAMGFNYNGQLRSAELLLRENGEIKQIRRGETLNNHFATLDLGQIAQFA